MNSDRLRPDQKHTLLAKLRPIAAFLDAMVQRCKELGFPADDAVLLATNKSLAAVREIIDILTGEHPSQSWAQRRLRDVRRGDV